MGYKATDPCLQKAFDDERLFVLMTRDQSAPEVVLEWIKLNIHRQPDHKLREAFECALEMKNRHTEIQDRKLEQKFNLNQQQNEIKERDDNSGDSGRV